MALSRHLDLLSTMEDSVLPGTFLDDSVHSDALALSVEEAVPELAEVVVAASEDETTVAIPSAVDEEALVVSVWVFAYVFGGDAVSDACAGFEHPDDSDVGRGAEVLILEVQGDLVGIEDQVDWSVPDDLFDGERAQFGPLIFH